MTKVKNVMKTFRYKYAMIAALALVFLVSAGGCQNTVEMSDWRIQLDAWHGSPDEYIKSQYDTNVKVEVDAVASKEGVPINDSMVHREASTTLRGSDFKAGNLTRLLGDIGTIEVDISKADKLEVKVSCINCSGVADSFLLEKRDNWVPKPTSIKFISGEKDNPASFDASVYMKTKLK